MAQDEAPHQRGMVVVAHADDAEWGCAGTVAKWCAQGWEVVYVLCTDGSKGSADPEMTSGRLVEVRKQEQLNAGNALGGSTASTRMGVASASIFFHSITREYIPPD